MDTTLILSKTNRHIQKTLTFVYPLKTTTVTKVFREPWPEDLSPGLTGGPSVSMFESPREGRRDHLCKVGTPTVRGRVVSGSRTVSPVFKTNTVSDEKCIPRKGHLVKRITKGRSLRTVESWHSSVPTRHVGSYKTFEVRSRRVDPFEESLRGCSCGRQEKP